MEKLKQFMWLALAVLLLTGLSLQTRAQEADDLQEYLDKLAAEQPTQQARQSVRRGETVNIPVGLTVVDLSKFTSYANRTKVLEVKSSLKFVNGTITAASNFSGGTPLLKIMNGATCVVDETSGVDASLASTSVCTEAVGIFGGSTFYQCCDVTAPGNGAGVAIYLDTAADTYIYVSGKTTGSISNPRGGTIIEEGAFDLQKAIDAVAASNNHGTKDNPVEIQLPDEYEIATPVVVRGDVFVRLMGGKLKIANSFDVANNYVIHIDGSIESYSALYIKNVTIDCNNKALHYSLFECCGDLYIEEGVTYQNINPQTGRDGGFYLNEGYLQISSGNVKVNGNVVYGGGSTTIDGGTLQGPTAINTNGNWAQGESMGSGPSVIINGGNIFATNTAINLSDNTYGATLYVNGGNISGTELFTQGSYCNAYLTGGTINVKRLIATSNETSRVGTSVYVGGKVALNIEFNMCIYATSLLENNWIFNCSNTNFRSVSFDVGTWNPYDPSAPLEETTLIEGSNYELSKSDFEKMTFNNLPDDLTVYYNENTHTVNIKQKELYTYDMLKDKLGEIGKKVTPMQDRLAEAKKVYEGVKDNLSVKNRETVEKKLGEIEITLLSFIKEKDELQNNLDKAAKSEYAALNGQIDDLAKRVDDYNASLESLLLNVNEQMKELAVGEIQQKLSDFETAVYKLQSMIDELYSKLLSMNGGTYFFEPQLTESFKLRKDAAAVEVNEMLDVKSLISDYNDWISNNTISTLDDVIRFMKKYEELSARLNTMNEKAWATKLELDMLQEQYNQLDVNFPTDGQAYTVAPTGIVNAIQLGYKSNRGFVLTSSGMLYFEQVSGATFRLKNQDDVYLVATKGLATLTAGTKETATVWTGKSLGNGSYTIYSSEADRYITASVGRVNEPVTAGTALQWTITESELDPLQAMLNLLAEEEENTGGDTPLTEKDTMRIVIPVCGCRPLVPFVFPRVVYPIVVRGKDLPIPSPSSGWRPENFHPYHIPKGSHVILDDVTFDDIVGGDHVIYVEGTIEINIKVRIRLVNWYWFIHVGPTGRIIWRYDDPDSEYVPRIKNDKGGTIDFVDGHIGYVDNRGTVNHTKGTINHVVNYNVYRFTGGIIDYLDNFGQQTQSGGQVKKIRNNEGGTYNMTGGEIRNTTVTVVDTVFVNCGEFNFTGGYLCGYGSRLIYHAKGAKLRIDGGMFCFDHIKDYWIEAWDDFYIRGDYDYEPTVPILLNPRVRIRVLYKWLYKFNIVFIGGRPMSRYPLFTGEEGLWLSRDYYKLIDWELPNHRWRWYWREDTNSIEPRDESIEDEDDLQAYLDWLEKYKDSEATSTAENPQIIDLENREIVITRVINIPVGTHVYFKRCRFVPSGAWDTDKVFYVPGNSTLWLEDIDIDFSSQIHYVYNYNVIQRYIFDIVGTIHFGPGCYIRGWLDTSLQPTDNFIPGAALHMDPDAKVYINGGRFENVVFYVNTYVNIFVSVNLDYDLYLYLPFECRYKNFRFMAPWNGYRFLLADLKRMKFLGTDEWLAKTDSEGYGSLFGTGSLGDTNDDSELNVADVVETVNYILGRQSSQFVEAAADMTGDGEVNVADVVEEVSTIMDADVAEARLMGRTSEAATDNDLLELVENGNGSLSLRLTNAGDYVASQFDLKLAEGQKLEGITLNGDRCGGHQVAYAKTGDNCYRVIVFSTANRTYQGYDGDLLDIHVKGNGNVAVDNILFVTGGHSEKRFQTLNGGTTGISGVMATMAMNIYDVEGRQVRSQANTTKGLAKGVYIINGKKHFVK